MIFKGTFSDSELETFHHEIEVKGVSSIHFNLLHGDFEHFLVIVKDPNGEVRALLTYKTRQKQYCLSTSNMMSSNYVKAGLIPDGIWTLDVVRTYPINGGYEFMVTFDQGTVLKEKKDILQQDFDCIYDARVGWYTGDIHLHSEYSDGRVDFETVSLAIQEKKLDFVAITEHSAVTTNVSTTNLPILPATEITWDDHGHYNVYGLKDLIDYSMYIDQDKTKDEAIQRMFDDLSSKGYIIQMNHPFPKGWTLLHNFDFRKIKLLEICNAPHLLTKEINNEKAVRFFDYLWNHGHYVYGTGGSDAHKKNYFDTYPVGIPSVKTYCEGLSIQHVLNAIKQGHIIVQKEILLEVEFKNQDSIVLPGDRVNGAVSLVARANKNVTWELIKNGELQIQSEGDFFKSEVYVNENEFYRIQAKVNDEIVGFINPIHNMTKAPNEIEFQKLLQDFEEKDMGK